MGGVEIKQIKMQNCMHLPHIHSTISIEGDFYFSFRYFWLEYIIFCRDPVGTHTRQKIGGFVWVDPPEGGGGVQNVSYKIMGYYNTNQSIGGGGGMV